MAERDRLFAKHPKTMFIAAHFGFHANDLDRLGRMLDRLPNVYTETGAIIEELARQPRAARAFFVKYQDRILFGKDTYEASRIPGLLPDVRDRRRVLRRLPRLPRVLEAVRPGPAGPGPSQALLRQRAASWSAACRVADFPPIPAAGTAARTLRLHGSLRRHRRSGVHRVAPGRERSIARGETRARRRQLHHRQPQEPRGDRRRCRAGRRRPGRRRTSRGARWPARTTCCTRRRSRRCRDRSRTRSRRIAPTSTRRCRCWSPPARPASSASSTRRRRRRTAIRRRCRSARTCRRARSRRMRCRS